MYKRASKRTGGAGAHGFSSPQWWAGTAAEEGSPPALASPAEHPFARRVIAAAMEKGGARPFVEGLSDYWLAELVSRLFSANVIRGFLLQSLWTKVGPRLKKQERAIALTRLERRGMEVAVAEAIEPWISVD